MSVVTGLVEVAPSMRAVDLLSSKAAPEEATVLRTWKPWLGASEAGLTWQGAVYG
jgi:hypothetical protein